MWCSEKGGVLSSGSLQVEASGGHVGGVTLPTWLVLAGASNPGGERRGSAQTSAPLDVCADV